MSTPDSEAIAASWPSVPLSQATTLCGSEISDKTNEPVAKQLHSHSSTLPTLSYLSKPVLKSFDSIAGSIKSTEGGKQSKTGLQKIRGNDWVIVIVCAYCLFYQVFACTLFTPVLAYRLKDMGVSNIEETAGYLASIWAAGCVVMSPIAGWLPLVYKNKRIQLIVYISILLAATLLFAFVPNVSGLMAGRLLHGLGASGVWTVAMALLNDSVSSQRVGRMTGFAQVGYAIGNSVSPTMGGALYAKLGWLPLCYFALALGGLNILLCLAYLEKEAETAEKSSTEAVPRKSSLLQVLKISLCNPKYFIGIAVGLCWGSFSNGVLYTALPLRLENHYSLSSASIGYSFLAIAGPNIVFAPLAGWMTDRLGARPLILASLGTFAVWSALLCIDALPYPGFLVVLVGIGASFSFLATPTLVYWTTVDRFYGRPVGASLICGIYSTAVSISCLILPLVSGIVLGEVGISVGWKILLGIITGCLLACLIFVWRYMCLPEPTPSTSEFSSEKLAQKAEATV